MKGAATFLSLPKLADALESIPQGMEVRIDLQELNYVDHACLDLIMNWESNRKANGGALIMDWGRLCAKFKEKQINPQDIQRL